MSQLVNPANRSGPPFLAPWPPSPMDIELVNSLYDLFLAMTPTEWLKLEKSTLKFAKRPSNRVTKARVRVIRDGSASVESVDTHRTLVFKATLLERQAREILTAKRLHYRPAAFLVKPDQMRWFNQNQTGFDFPPSTATSATPNLRRVAQRLASTLSRIPQQVPCGSRASAPVCLETFGIAATGPATGGPGIAVPVTAGSATDRLATSGSGTAGTAAAGPATGGPGIAVPVTAGSATSGSSAVSAVIAGPGTARLATSSSGTASTATGGPGIVVPGVFGLSTTGPVAGDTSTARSSTGGSSIAYPAGPQAAAARAYESLLWYPMDYYRDYFHDMYDDNDYYY